MSLVLACWRLRQEDCCVVEASLGYGIRPYYTYRYKTPMKGVDKISRLVKYLLLALQGWRPQFHPWSLHAPCFSVAVIYIRATSDLGAEFILNLHFQS